MKFKFQTFFDIQTSAASMQILQWSVGGNEVLQRCRHLFGAYKYFKLGKISVKMVPASTLPVDPLGLSYGDSDPQTVDPRDQMNPGLVRITNGEDIFTDVASLQSPIDGIDRQMAHYNAMMLDPRWSKFMLQSGFRRSAYPLYWQVGQLNQDKYPGSTINFRYANGNASLPGTLSVYLYGGAPNDGSLGARCNAGSSGRGLFQVGHRGKLGWLPTDFFQEVPQSGSVNRFTTESGINNIPEVSVITCVLPKAYKTLYYYRVFITEEVLFSGLRSAPYIQYGDTIGADPHVFNPLDQFVIGTPTTGINTTAVNDKKLNNGDGKP